MKKIAIAMLVMLIVAASGYGAWFYAADRGLIAGMPNSPRIENFQAALNQYMTSRSMSGYFRDACVNVGSDYGGRQNEGFKDTRYDITPTAYLYSTDAVRDPNGSRRAQMDYLAKQGYFESRTNPKGGTDYEMTWKGYAASQARGCIQLHGSERFAKIIGFEKKRTDNGVDIYEVTANSLPKTVEPWAQTPEFKNVFPQQAATLQNQQSNPVAYELARGEQGFLVIKAGGRDYQNRANEHAALMVKMAGTLTADQIKKAVEAYAVKSQNSIRNGLCLRLPTQAEVDEISRPGGGAGYAALQADPATFDVYNVTGRSSAESGIIGDRPRFPAQNNFV